MTLLTGDKLCSLIAELNTLNAGLDYPANRFGRSQRRYSPARINLHKGWTGPLFFAAIILVVGKSCFPV